MPVIHSSTNSTNRRVLRGGPLRTFNRLYMGDHAATIFSGPCSLVICAGIAYSEAVGFAFLVFAAITFKFPSQAPVSEVSMNYINTAIGVVALLSILTWITTGYKHFHGPADVLKLDIRESPGEFSTKK